MEGGGFWGEEKEVGGGGKKFAKSGKRSGIGVKRVEEMARSVPLLFSRIRLF